MADDLAADTSTHMRAHPSVEHRLAWPTTTSGRQRPTVPARISRAFASVIERLRAGYPDDAPRTGYSPLLALCGPVALSARQTARIVAELSDRPTDSVSIGTAITKATNRLPTDAQTRTIARALDPTPLAIAYRSDDRRRPL